MTKQSEWLDLCSIGDLVENSGVCALLKEQQIALFYLPAEQKVYAVGQYDPFGNANVISRGIIGSKEGKLFVASPLYKQHFLLEDGCCLEDETVSLPVWKTQIINERVMIQTV
ncbi:nitrite reductase small subunit NirD [Neptunomonas qingdaonensis]|uniref:Nitrite reductase (NADH) large subunit/nitrite reductase (NADH) small subunit n=1 Tax=Neptunomonas qingdaonensis TaxID=1045558 RepID=A0A1I2QAS5_9GAMM|nr:nitrite reductase small subunit NirD [Neptunomonas qingdaonensis]SFG24753.1 nitrite reductase (NADH) large subunit/nitrite reductase (NADH) small subunit [Neptunomonas qingdaonensis]